jgi:hypothetical protein
MMLLRVPGQGVVTYQMAAAVAAVTAVAVAVRGVMAAAVMMRVTGSEGHWMERRRWSTVGWGQGWM